MQLAEKQELVRLLNVYQQELLADNDSNIKKKLDNDWNRVSGVKAQYNHARCIATKLSYQIGQELSTY